MDRNRKNILSVVTNTHKSKYGMYLLICGHQVKITKLQYIELKRLCIEKGGTDESQSP